MHPATNGLLSKGLIDIFLSFENQSWSCAWLLLKADALRPKQNRRTGRALFAQIKASAYVGGYTLATDFFRSLRASAGKEVKAFVPLSSSWVRRSSLTGAKKA